MAATSTIKIIRGHLKHSLGILEVVRERIDTMVAVGVRNRGLATHKSHGFVLGGGFVDVLRVDVKKLGYVTRVHRVLS